MQTPPDRELPRRTVPETAQEHHKEKVEVSPARPLPISPQRDVEVIPQP